MTASAATGAAGDFNLIDLDEAGERAAPDPSDLCSADPAPLISLSVTRLEATEAGNAKTKSR
jgi:hypothetical protein